MLAYEGLLRGLAISFLVRSTGGEIGDAVFAETSAELVARDEPIGGGQPIGAIIQPGLAPAVAHPLAARPLDALDELEIGSVGFKPGAERRPLSQEALMRHLNDVDAGPPVGDEQPRVDKPLDDGYEPCGISVSRATRRIGAPVSGTMCPSHRMKAARKEASCASVSAGIAGDRPGSASALATAASIEPWTPPSLSYSAIVSLPPEP